MNTVSQFKSLGKRTSAVVSFDEKWFFNDSAQYNHGLARLCAGLTLATYRKPASGSTTNDCPALETLAEAGLENPGVYANTADDEVDFMLANRRISDGNGNEKTLIYCGCVGSHKGQWYNNFDAGTGDIHQGFKSARDFVYEKLAAYVEKYGAGKDKTVLLFTGHSRGGATANLLAAKTVDDELLALPENIFSYTFATPCSALKEKTADSRYNRIFSFVNEEDFVTRCMPMEWGFARYGRTFALPNVDNTANYGYVLKKLNAFYPEYTKGKIYYPFTKGTKVLNGLFESLAANEKTIKDYYEKLFDNLGNSVTLAQYFRDSLCAVIAEEAGSKKNKDGTMLLLNTFLRRFSSDPMLVKVADFFVLYEGLAGATKDKISRKYFSFSHDVCTYCAAMMASEEYQLKEK